MVDLINLFEVSFYFNAKYKIKTWIWVWLMRKSAFCKCHGPATIFIYTQWKQQPGTMDMQMRYLSWPFVLSAARNWKGLTEELPVWEQSKVTLPFGLWKHIFLCCHGDFFANELNRWTIKYCQMQRRELFLCLIKSWPTLQLEYLGMPHVTVSGT